MLRYESYFLPSCVSLFTKIGSLKVLILSNSRLKRERVILNPSCCCLSTCLEPCQNGLCGSEILVPPTLLILGVISLGEYLFGLRIS